MQAQTKILIERRWEGFLFDMEGNNKKKEELDLWKLRERRKKVLLGEGDKEAAFWGGVILLEILSHLQPMLPD